MHCWSEARVRTPHDPPAALWKGDDIGTRKIFLKLLPLSGPVGARPYALTVVGSLPSPRRAQLLKNGSHWGYYLNWLKPPKSRMVGGWLPLDLEPQYMLTEIH